jgi:hypothetical protein
MYRACPAAPLLTPKGLGVNWGEAAAKPAGKILMAFPILDIDLIAAREALQEQHGAAPSYQRLWGAAASGRIPARRVGRGWRVHTADLPLIAGYFGLTASRPDAA